jgi:hypothetical protein
MSTVFISITIVLLGLVAFAVGAFLYILSLAAPVA